jgi:hypothetical protein
MDVNVAGCGYNYEYGALGKPIRGLPLLYDPSSNFHCIAAPEDLSGLLAVALKTMVPKIQAELSLPNSIYELKDMKSVPKTIESIRLLTGTAGKLAKVLVEKTTRNKLRWGSDVYLQYKFNVKPLISDVSSIYAALSRTERRINDFISRQGRPKVAHFQRNLCEYKNSYEKSPPSSLRQPIGWASTAMLDGSSSSERFVNYKPSVFHAQIEFSYYYSRFQAEHARLLSLLDAYGINFNPAIIWNALPWTFVLDWLIGVSRFLNELHLGLMDPEVCIHRALWSIKRSRSILVQTSVSTPSNYGTVLPTQTLVHPMTTETAYRRELWNWKDAATSLTTSGLSLTEASLAAALGFSRRGRKRRGRK